MKNNSKLNLIVIIFVSLFLLSSCTLANEDNDIIDKAEDESTKEASADEDISVESSDSIKEEVSEAEIKEESEELKEIEIEGKIFRKPEKNTSKNNSEFNSEANSEANSEVVKEETTSKVSVPNKTPPLVDKKEIVGVWLSYLDYVGLLQDKSESDARQSIEDAFKNLSDDGFNTIYLQIRPFSDAIYPSKIYPWSHILNSDLDQGVNPGYDPLKIIMEIAKSNNISVHGWVNPYRIKLNSHPKSYAESNILNNNNMTEKDYIILENGTYINPASKNGQKIVIDGIKEVLLNYELDGIQFDDYFYPSTNENIDKAYYNEYKIGGGSLALDDWRRENVNTLVKNVYGEIKKIDENIVFGISPESNISRNYTQHYADVEKWSKEKGFVDYLMPQVYFGFDHKTAAFAPAVKSWNELLKNSHVDLLVGLGPYKIGLKDSFAGVTGENEWENNGNLLIDQYNESKKQETYKGVCLFRYDSIYNPSGNVKGQIEKEFNNFKEGLN